MIRGVLRAANPVHRVVSPLLVVMRFRSVGVREVEHNTPSSIDLFGTQAACSDILKVSLLSKSRN